MNEQQAAMRQALEALENCYGYRNWEWMKEAITALRQALQSGTDVEQRPTVKDSLMVDSTCKNCLQVWVIPSSKQFSWEPQDERFWTRMGPVEQQPATRPATREEKIVNPGVYEAKEKRIMSSQQQDVPCIACGSDDGKHSDGCARVRWGVEQQSADEPVAHWSDCAVHSEPAYPKGECDCGGYAPITELYDAAKVFYNATVADSQVRITSKVESKRDIATSTADRLRNALLVFNGVRPQTAAWVGLTAEDKRELEKQTTVGGYHGDYNPPWDLMEAVEAKLKEKNNGNW